MKRIESDPMSSIQMHVILPYSDTHVNCVIFFVFCFTILIKWNKCIKWHTQNEWMKRFTNCFPFVSDNVT